MTRNHDRLYSEIRKAASVQVNQWSQQQDYFRTILMPHEEEGKNETLVSKTCDKIRDQLKGWIDDAIPRKLKVLYEAELFKPNPSSPLTIKIDGLSSPTKRSPAGFGLESSKGATFKRIYLSFCFCFCSVSFFSFKKKRKVELLCQKNWPDKNGYTRMHAHTYAHTHAHKLFSLHLSLTCVATGIFFFFFFFFIS